MAVNSSLPSTLRGKKVFVGISGGVDSAVTAALLQQAGAHVTAVFIKGWYPPDMPCTWGDDRRDAMRVAAHLNLPFITLDASDEYRRGVIDYLLREYKAGRTPNPDIMCNREVKFGAFYRYAKEQGVDYIATGHYAQSVHSAETEGAQERAALLRGIDDDKDQSYFLWAIPKEALDMTLFPLGGMHKSEVRALAESFALPNARKRDSQGICFLGSVSVEDFLAQEFSVESGTALGADGAAIGMHTGAILSTIGQRVHLTDAPPGPWYVIAKDIEKNSLTVAHAIPPSTEKQLLLTDTNWFTTPDSQKTYQAQYRYHGPRITGTLDSIHSAFIPSDPVPERPASGQSLVLYDGEECIGGGIIA